MILIFYRHLLMETVQVVFILRTASTVIEADLKFALETLALQKRWEVPNHGLKNGLKRVGTTSKQVELFNQKNKGDFIMSQRPGSWESEDNAAGIWAVIIIVFLLIVLI